MKTLKELLYSDDHEWVRIEGDKAYIGVSDEAQHAMGEIVFVDLPRVDDEFKQGDIFTAIESVKAAFDCMIPVSGKVIEVNEELSDHPENINNDPYGSWIIVVEMSDKSDLDKLMNEEQFIEFCKKEEA